MGVNGLKERGYKMSPETHLLAGGPTDLMALPPAAMHHIFCYPPASLIFCAL